MGRGNFLTPFIPDGILHIFLDKLETAGKSQALFLDKPRNFGNGPEVVELTVVSPGCKGPVPLNELEA